MVSWHVLSTRLLLALVALLFAASAQASEPQLQRAQALFKEGTTAFDTEKYQVAYDRFHEAYGLSSAPALLFDMAAALEALGRPGDAATSLRAYMRVVREDRDRGAHEARARSLEESQRLIEVERMRAERPRLIDLNAVEARGKKRGLAIGLGVTGGVVLGAALAIGLTFGLQSHYPASTLGTQRATP